MEHDQHHQHDKRKDELLNANIQTQAALGRADVGTHFAEAFIMLGHIICVHCQHQSRRAPLAFEHWHSTIHLRHYRAGGAYCDGCQPVVAAVTAWHLLGGGGGLFSMAR